MQRREINIQLRYERRLPNSDWHTDIEGGAGRGGGMDGRMKKRENRQEMESKMSKACVLLPEMH